MGKNKKKEYVLDAVLDEETYMAYKSGHIGLNSPLTGKRIISRNN